MNLRKRRPFFSTQVYAAIYTNYIDVARCKRHYGSATYYLLALALFFRLRTITTFFTEPETQCPGEIEKQPVKLSPEKKVEDDHIDDCFGSHSKKINSQNVYVQTNITEIDENIRLNNLMFCKFISHELDKYQAMNV